MSYLGFVVLFFGCFLLAPTPASACRFGPPPVYTVDASLPDDVAPGAVDLLDVTVERGGGTSGCTGSDSCGDIASVYIAVSAEDDQTPTDAMGYLFELVDGDGYVPPRDPIPAPDGEITFHMSDHGGAMRYDLEVRAVDQAGNVGPPTLVQVRNGTGCAIGGGASSASSVLLAVGLLALRRRRPRG